MLAPNTVSELQELALARPAVDAAAGVVAAWYERKAVVLEHLAMQGSPEVAELAEQAHRHAAGVLLGNQSFRRHETRKGA